MKVAAKASWQCKCSFFLKENECPAQCPAAAKYTTRGLNPVPSPMMLQEASVKGK